MRKPWVLTVLATGAVAAQELPRSGQAALLPPGPDFYGEKLRPQFHFTPDKECWLRQFSRENRADLIAQPGTETRRLSNHQSPASLARAAISSSMTLRLGHAAAAATGSSLEKNSRPCVTSLYVCFIFSR